VTAEEFLATVESGRREDLRRLDDLIRATAPELDAGATRTSLTYGPFHYRYASGREGDTHVITLMNRKAYIAMYVNAVDDGEYVAERYAVRLPKADVGKSCVRIKRLDDLDLDVLRELVATAQRVGGAGAAQ
jgi:hypothetical protein